MAAMTPDIPKTELAIVEMTNAFRKENKLGEVKPEPRLTAAARAYASFLAKSDLFSHTADGRQPADRIKTTGYTFCQVAENLALNLDTRGFETRQLAGEAVEGWKKSPGHRKNMLAPHVTEIGVGIAKAKGEEKYLSVQLFGRPDSLKYEFRIENISGAAIAYRHGSERHELKPSFSVRHTACLPGELTVETAKTGAVTRAVNSRFETRDGDRFVVRTAKDGGKVGGVEVEHTRASAAVR